MNAQDPELLLEIRIGSSGDLLQSFDRRELDTAIVRLHVGRSDGELVAERSLDGSPRRTGSIERANLCRLPRSPSPVACARWPGAFSMPPGCHGEVFVGGGVAAVAAAVMAGLGVAALAPRMLPFGAIDIGSKLGLPELPRLPILLHTGAKTGRTADALAELSAAFRSAVRG